MYRPASVTVFGVLNLIIGIFGLLGAGSNLLLVLNGLPSMWRSPMQDVINRSHWLTTWHWTNIALGELGTLLCLISGIGLLDMKRWGRKLAVGYAIYSVIRNALHLATISFITRIVLARGPLSAVSRVAEIPTSVLMIIGMLTLVFPIVYAGLLWYFMTRPHVIAAFERRGSPFLLGPGGASPFRTQEDVPHGPSGDNPFAAPPSID